MEFFRKLKQYDIILASQSPRRRALMEAAGIPFRTMVKPTSEHFPEDLKPAEIVSYLCRAKADCFNEELKQPGVVLITADTIVVHGGEIINKPSGAEEAFSMLSRLSGSTHEVYTGVCIRTQQKEIVFHDHSLVTFRALTEEEIRYYIAQYAPWDKAGAYGIQEWIGYIGIESIEGSYPNVMGMPVHKVYLRLADLLDHS
ncbi:MAG: Maf family nucleotide pyrophosphatase [Bacteroidales bacterium]|nr:Maf family nucleotide pyrophosphatase [Bacteroidales bacterium]